MAENKGMDFIREYASAPERYLPLHSDWKGRAKEEGIDPEDQDTDYGWSAGSIGNRPWFLEYWGRWGIEMITVYLSADGMEEVSAADLDRMMEENGIWRAKAGAKYGPEMETVTDSDGTRFYSISRAAKVDEKCMLEAHAPLHRWEELLAGANL